MINLTQLGPTGQRVCLTLTEATCNGTGPWAFLLESVVTGSTVLFTAPDVSNSPGRYQEFVWQSVGPTGVDLTDGRIYLSDAGTYDYTAYQATVSEAMVVSGAGTTGIDGSYLEDGTFNGYPRWTKAGGTSNEDSIYVATLSPQELWAITSGGSYAHNPLNVKYYNGVTAGMTSNGGPPIDWLQATGGDYPAPTSVFTLTITPVSTVETGRLQLHGPTGTLPAFSEAPTVIPTFQD